MKALQIVIFLLVSLFIQDLSSQTTHKQITGSEECINQFNGYAEKIGIDDLRLSNDSLRIRIWDAGKLLDFNINGDSIYVQKIIYILTNPSYKRNPKKGKVIGKRFEITDVQKELIEEKIVLIGKNNPLGRNIDFRRDSFYMNNSRKINSDSISPQNLRPIEGGIVQAIEFSDKDNYFFWCSLPPIDSQAGLIIKSIMDDLDMKNERALFYENLPKGAWYSFGGTVAIYKMSFWESLFRGFPR